MAIQLPKEFIKSYRAFREYPQSLQAQAIYGPALWGYRERLKRRSAKLFLRDPHDFVIPLRSVDRGSNGQLEGTMALSQ